ncbi:cysteine proteinase, partial [Fistulina hepatica ATCC 64428]
IETVWPSSYGNESAGLYNQGNTCFLNSALQVLLHTPPLLHMLLEHTECTMVLRRSQAEPHVVTGPLAGRFCMICSLRAVSLRSSRGNKPFSPNAIVSKLQAIAKHMRPGRQEDSHEFLRYAIDALQKSCLARYSPKMDAKLAETTWVHRIFGGQLRSRVKCQECGHSSDTFDSILDLSLDIYKVQDVKAALRKFVTPDYLKGTDKYKCEKHVAINSLAEKRFSVHQAPTVLTVHLKRFSPYGGKDGHPISYDESLLLQPFMSPGQHGPRYTLYGVICHAGGGPNSGHYYAYVRGKSGQWFEMNDETVSRHSTPLRIKSAYMLFYLR